MKRTRRLCIVYWDLGLGGIQKRIRDVVNTISSTEKNWKIYILLRRHVREGFESQIRPTGRVHIRYYPFVGNLRPPLGFIFWVVLQYSRIKPDVVLTFQPMLSSLLILIKKINYWIPSKLVINEGAVTSQLLKWEHLSYFYALIRILYPLADAIIVPTRACKKDLITRFQVPENKIIIVPNWTLLTPMKPLSPRFDFIFIGRFSPEKNPLFLIGLAKKLVNRFSNLQIAMVGYGPLQDNLYKEIQKNQLQTVIHMFPFSYKTENMFRHTRILLVPSFNEGMPNVVLEAAMCSVPTVARNFPGAEEVILNGKTGYIGADDESMRTHAEKLFVDELTRASMGQSALNFTARSFTNNQQARFISILFE